MKLYVVGVALFLIVCAGHASVQRYRFELTDTAYTRLCRTKNILVVNGQFPGPTLYATEGDTLIVDVINNARENVTIHWHGVKQPRFPWSDGPEMITQCAIQPGTNFSQRITLSDEVGTLWWHAHSDWSRATVHGALVIRPNTSNGYPFATPYAELPVILGEWWNSQIQDVLNEFVASGGDPNSSDTFLINGQPGDLFPCSIPDATRFTVDQGRTYLLRLINAVMNTIMFFRIANHNMTVVGSDGAYTNPFTTDIVAISPGQTIDLLLTANQMPSHYRMASRAHAVAGAYNNLTTTAIVQYSGNYSSPPSPPIPQLPDFNDTATAIAFTSRLRSQATRGHPVDVPQTVNAVFLFTLSINAIPCTGNDTCGAALGSRLGASINNITFVQPRISILQAYYNRIRGVYGINFPRNPPFVFNYTQDPVPQLLWVPRNGTEVREIAYNSSVELVFQGTNAVAGIYHPMHLHGYSFYVVGSGDGNFNQSTDPLSYNLVDPPLMNTIAVRRSGWTAIRFRADNPGVWLLHCHLERHVTWGMEMTFIVRDGRGRNARMLPPPPDMPRC